MIKAVRFHSKRLTRIQIWRRLNVPGKAAHLRAAARNEAYDEIAREEKSMPTLEPFR
jgi:hypothetical protein